MAKTNFQYEKRQRELEKKKRAEQKAEEKARRKLEARQQPAGEHEAGEAGTDSDGGPDEERADPHGPP